MTSTNSTDAVQRGGGGGGGNQRVFVVFSRTPICLKNSFSWELLEKSDKGLHCLFKIEEVKGFNETVLSTFRAIFPGYIQRQSTQQCYQCFDSNKK